MTKADFVAKYGKHCEWFYLQTVSGSRVTFSGHATLNEPEGSIHHAAVRVVIGKHVQSLSDHVYFQTIGETIAQIDPDFGSSVRSDDFEIVDSFP